MGEQVVWPERAIKVYSKFLTDQMRGTVGLKREGEAVPRRKGPDLVKMAARRIYR